MPTHFDIIIHGGGLAGNSLALALAKTSLQIGVVEPYPPSNKQRHLLESRTIALSHGARRIYEGIGVWLELAPFCTPIQHIHVSDKGRFGMTRIHAAEQHMPALGYVLQIAEVNRVLCEKLQHYSNIHYLSPAKITNANLINEKWQLEIESNNGASYTCDLLVAADGGQSPLRQMAGLTAEEKDYQQTAIVTSVQLTRSHENIAYERFIDDGPIALLPIKEDICAVVVTVANKALAKWQAMTDVEFLRTLQHQFGYRLGRFIAMGSRTTYPLKLVQTSQQVSPQFVLVGNAAHVLHPIAAQSFNLSLRDIAVLAELIINSIKNEKSIINPALLEEYAKQRTADQHRTVKFTDGLIEFFANPVFAVPRNIAMTGLDMVPPLKTLLGKYGAGTLGKLSRLARGIGV
jgi:2-octaprenyl-6-methoxyphenol hydroxylase